MAVTGNCVVICYLLGLVLVIKYYQSYICGEVGYFVELERDWLNGSLIAGVDGISIFLIWLTLAILPVCILASGESSNDSRMKLFLSCYLVLQSIIVAVFTCCGDLFMFYFVFEFVLIPMYLMIGIWGSKKTRILSAYQLFFYTLVGSFFMLLAMGLIFYSSGTFCYFFLSGSTFSNLREMILGLCFLSAFATKIPMFPLQIGLPEAHVEASTTGSVILAALLLKLGTYGFLRGVGTMMPVASHQLIPLILTMALVAIVLTSLTTSRQIDLKKILAYSSCGHMNLLIVGLLSSNMTAIAGSIIMHVSHGFVSAGLFIFVGQLYERFYTRNIKYLRGLASPLPLLGTFFLLFTFANISVPGSLNFIAEIMVFIGTFTKNTGAASLAATGVFLGATYSLGLATRVLFGSVSLYIQGFNDLNMREVVVGSSLLVPVALFGFYPQPMCGCIVPSLHFGFLHLAICIGSMIVDRPYWHGSYCVCWIIVTA